MRKYTSKINQIIGKFKVIEDYGLKLPLPESKKPMGFVKVTCLTCNAEFEGQYTHFKYGGRKCLLCEPKTYTKRRTYVGEIHGNFEIIQDINSDPIEGKRIINRRVIGKCLACERECESTYSTFQRLKRACECKYELERSDDWIKIRKTRLGMLDRCYNFQNHNFFYYGGRGITICDEWLESNKSFYDWAIQNGYQSHLTIDRIDNLKGYYPENCRWATHKTQARNRRNVISEEQAKNVKKLLLQKFTHQEIARELRISHHVVSSISKGSCWRDI